MSTPTAGTLSAPESLPAPETPDNDEELELLAEFAEVTNPRQRAFLAAYVMAKGVRGAQRLSGVSRITHCRWLSKDALYRECFELARSVIAAEAEEEAYRRAFLGCDMPISYHGNIRSWYKSYSDALAIFVLKGMKSDVYGRYAPDPNAGGVSGIEITIRKQGEETKEAAALPQITIPYEEPEE